MMYLHTSLVSVPSKQFVAMASKLKVKSGTNTKSTHFTKCPPFTHVQACIKSDGHLVFVRIDDNSKLTLPRGDVSETDFKHKHAYLAAIKRIFVTKVGIKFPKLKNFKINDFHETRTYIGECEGFGRNIFRFDSPYYDMIRIKIEDLFDPQYAWWSCIDSETWKTLEVFHRYGHLK